MTNQPSQAYLEGRDAHREGYGVEDNPYKYWGTGEDLEDWERGWTDQDYFTYHERPDSPLKPENT